MTNFVARSATIVRPPAAAIAIGDITQALDCVLADVSIRLSPSAVRLGDIVRPQFVAGCENCIAVDARNRPCELGVCWAGVKRAEKQEMF